MRFSSFFLVLINSASTTLALPYDLHTSLAFNEYDDSFDDPLFLSNSNTEPDTPSLRPIGYSEFPEIPDSHSELIAATSGGVRTSDVVTIPIANLFPNSCKQQSLKGLCCDGSGSGNTKLGCVECKL